jgi:hypothetical protein
VIALAKSGIPILVYDDNSGDFPGLQFQDNITYKTYGDHHNIDDDPNIVSDVLDWLKDK